MPGIAIPSGDLWSFNAALLEFAEGQLRLKDLRTVNDDFDAAMDSAIWNNSTNSGGTVTDEITSSKVYMKTGSAANAAIRILKSTLDETSEFSFSAVVGPNYRDGVDDNDLMILFNSILEPTTMTTAALSADRVLVIISNEGTDGTFVFYIDNVGSNNFWNGSAFQGGSTTVPTVGKIIFRNFDDSGTMKWQLFLLAPDGSSQSVTDPVVWSATRAPAGGKSLWAFFGDARTDTSRTGADLFRFERWPNEGRENYSTTSPTATSPWFAIDQNTLDAVTAILLQLILEGTSTIKFQWALNNGAFNGSFLTPSQLLAALVGQSITDHTNSMRLMAQFNSNGNDLPQMLVPQTKAEASGLSGGSQAPIEDVRNGTIYNDGALTGTAFIPAKPDTRKDTPVDDGVGTLAVASANDVRENVPTDDTVGNYVPAVEANHALGDSYGSNGTEFTGTKALTPFKLPVEVIIEDEEILVFEGAE